MGALRLGGRTLLAGVASSCALFIGVSGASAAGPYPGIPDPGGNPDASVPVPPPPGKFFGYHEFQATDSPHGWTHDQMAGVAAGGGANMVRIQVGWWNVEPTRDHWDENWWEKYAAIYRALLAKGIRPLITIADVPVWAREPAFQAGCSNRRGCEFAPARAMEGEWAAFAGEVARRFPQAAAIEVWNEPNLRNFYKPEPSPGRYAEIATAAYYGIKAANPSMTVLAGALAPTQTAQYELGHLVAMPMKAFLDQAYASAPSLKNHMDGLSFHSVIQDLDYGAESAWAKFFHDMRSIRAKYGDGHIPLWLTETGLTTGASIGMTEYQQAVGLMLQYRRVMTMPDTKGMIIHTLGDRVELPVTDFNREYGVVRSFHPWVPKLAFCAFAGRVNTPTPYGGCPKITDPGADTDPPETNIISGPQGTIDDTTPTFGFNSTEGNSTFECRVDGGEWSGCTSPKTLAVLADGMHGFEVRAIDAAGNTDPSPAFRIFVIDTTIVPPPPPPPPPPDELNCSERIAAVTLKLAKAEEEDRPLLQQRYRTLMKRCVPCKRKLTKLKRKLKHAADGPRRERLLKRYRTTKARCMPCLKKLRSLQRQMVTADAETLTILIRRHERARQRCTGIRRTT